MTQLDLATADETYRMSQFGFTSNGILTDTDLETLLKQDAKTLGLAHPVPAPKVFDFSVQRDQQRIGNKMNLEFGVFSLK